MKIQKNIDSPDLAILGAIGPPWGGVGVHIDRIINSLSSEDISFRMYDRLGKDIPDKNIVPGEVKPLPFFFQIATLKEHVVHIHTANLTAITFSSIILKLKKKYVMITLHNEKIFSDFSKLSFIHKFFFKFAIKQVDQIVCVNRNILNWINANFNNTKACSIIPAFVPPYSEEIDRKNLDAEIIHFIESHNPIIGSHGWFGYFINSLHVYSFDMLLPLMVRLKKTHPDVGIYIVLSGSYDKGHKDSFYKTLIDSKMDKDIFVIEKTNFHAASIFTKSDLFLRPTVTDGDSVSVRECLFLGVPVIASDCVERPKGCTTFRNRSQSDLEAKTLRILNNLKSEKYKLKKIKIEDPSKKLIKIYKDAINCRTSNK